MSAHADTRPELKRFLKTSLSERRLRPRFADLRFSLFSAMSGTAPLLKHILRAEAVSKDASALN